MFLNRARLLLFGLAGLLLLLIPACSQGAGAVSSPDTEQVSSESPAGPEALRVVATTTQASDLARILAEGVPGVEITSLMGAGVDPHLYQPTERDISAMSAADIIIYSGLLLEGQFDAVFDALADRNVRVYALSGPVKEAGFVVGNFDSGRSQAGTDDPHFWFDPRNWELSVLDLAQVLSEMDPEYARAYGKNARGYVTQLELLFRWADAGMRSVLESQRYLVTSHDAFQYFGAAFGWRVSAIQGISTEDEAGVGDIEDTVDFVISQEIPVLFVESSIPPNTIEAVEEAIDAAGGEVRLGVRELYSDAMGAPGEFGGTYIGMIGQNVLTVLQSYGCAGATAEIPPWPEELTIEPPPEVVDVRCSE